MVLDAVSNFVRGETDAAIDSAQTTVSVVDASIFPDPATDGEYNVVIWDAGQYPRPDQDPNVEILRVTAIDTGTDDLTAGASHPSGSAVHLSPTAKMFGDIENTFADFWDAGAQELTADVNNDTVSTGEATIGQTGPIEEVGYVDFGTVSANSTETTTVSFAKSYSTAPSVAIGFGSTAGHAEGSEVLADIISTTDFRARVSVETGVDRVVDRCGYIVIQS